MTIKTLNDLPPEVKARIQQHANQAIGYRNLDPQSLGLHLLYIVANVLAECPEMWTVIAHLAAGDFVKADEELQ